MKITIDENDKITVELDNGHVQVFPPEWQEDCVKAALQKEKSAEMKSQLEMETDRADAWELRCSELEQENRELKEAELHLQAVVKETEDANRHLTKEHNEMLDEIARLRDRIREQDVTIAKYDDENRALMERLSKCGEKPFPVSMNEWAECIHRIAVDHGWWETDEGACDDGERPLPEILMLCVTELAEAMEEYRNGKPNAYIVGGQYGELCIEEPEKWGDHKPEGVAVEMIDCIIRILDWCGKEGIDVDAVLRRKHEYNKGRPYRHGGKKA